MKTKNPTRFQVGTTSKLRLGYNKGPSSWVHCSCLVYENGQLIALKKNTKRTKHEN